MSRPVDFEGPGGGDTGDQFTCFTGTKVQILTQKGRWGPTDDDGLVQISFAAHGGGGGGAAKGAARGAARGAATGAADRVHKGRLEGIILRSHLRQILGARFMRDGGTPNSLWQRGTQLTCSTGIQVQILPEILGARCMCDMAARPILSGKRLLSFLALLVQKYKYSRIRRY